MQIMTLSFVKYFQLRVVIKNNNERKENLKKKEEKSRVTVTISVDRHCWHVF